jgi:hypothetical protein
VFREFILVQIRETSFKVFIEEKNNSENAFSKGEKKCGGVGEKNLLF